MASNGWRYTGKRLGGWSPRIIWPVIATAGVFIYVAGGITTAQMPPRNAVVIADLERKTYASPPCVIRGQIDRELITNREEIADRTKGLVLRPYALTMTIDQMYSRKFKPDDRCNNANGLIAMTPLWRRVLGLDQARWTNGGDWLW